MRYILVLLVLASCTPDGKLRRLLKKHPELVKVDSVRVADTTIINDVRKDTIFKLSEQHDTVIIQKENLTIKHYYDRTTDKVFVSGECKGDTLIKWYTKYKYMVQPAEKRKGFVQKLKDYLLLLIILCIIAFLGKRLLKQNK